MKIELAFVLISLCLYASIVRCSVPSAQVLTASPLVNAPDESSPSRITIATFGDIIIHCVTDSAQASPSRIHIRQRDADGNYQLLHDVANTWAAYNPVTNGKWLALLGRDATLVIGRLDVDFNFVNATDLGYSPVAGGFFSDDTFVVYDHPYDLKTLQYTEVDGWAEIGELTFQLPPGQYAAATIGPSLTIGEYFLSQQSAIQLRINQRLPNGTWSQVDSMIDIPDLMTYAGIALYDGIDTVAISFFAENTDSSILSTGLLRIYKKTSGQWSLLQQFSVADLGVTGGGGAGGSMAMPDRDTILYGVPTTYNFSDPEATYPSGKVFVLRRNETGQYAVTSTLYTNERVAFGYNLAFNDHDLIMTGVNPISESFFFSIPTCFDSPINVTCDNLDLDSSCSFDTTSLYAISNPQCGSVKVKMSGVQATENHKITVEYQFTRNFINDTCTSLITCPIPPVSPVAVTVPPTAVTTPTAKTSLSGTNVCSLSLPVMFVLAML